MIERLLCFESKFHFLYDFEVNGYPVYDGLRDSVMSILKNGKVEDCTLSKKRAKHISFTRIIQGIIKTRKFKKANTLVFTSSMYRRDKGRNLAVEYLMGKYPNTVVFEWPSNTKTFDNAYFEDKLKALYCPLDYFSLLRRTYKLLKKNEYFLWENQCRNKIKSRIEESNIGTCSENEKIAIAYIVEKMPISYAENLVSQHLFQILFERYDSIKYAIDFWGAARENIIPVLRGEFQAIELQHGIITSIHQGYIYPKSIKKSGTKFWNRKILVYDQKTKKLLYEKSVFNKEQLEVIGNPRIQMYRKEFSENHKLRNIILFTSQPFEQDGYGIDYYSTIIPFLQEIIKVINDTDEWHGYVLGIKLHPRENDQILRLYKQALPGAVVFDNTSELYQLLSCSIVHITVSSTCFYEALTFDTPTICIRYSGISLASVYGFEPWVMERVDDVRQTFTKMLDNKLPLYLDYIKSIVNKANL